MSTGLHPRLTIDLANSTIAQYRRDDRARSQRAAGRLARRAARRAR
jgi:hypothetical protein